ncbi:hypothetical protein KI743_06630 [Vibrio sp. D420a]|uniref:hypothetical protein n=1 Tax=Vibrio sp. D420a TaxID=2836895 RepID=UPI00255602C7|nr:hypothetical protein [Vibrio sp. D420a]MDK9761670.1 hypothetical protein [Vibrio sp. D420a]
MVNQTIEKLLQEAIDQSIAQTQESRELADDVSGLIGDIRNEVALAVQRTDEAIGRVDVAIPTAVDDELNQHLYLDTVNGDDGTATGSSLRPYKTLKALVDSAPVGACICVRGSSNQVIDIDDNIVLLNKHLTFFLQDTTYNFNARIIPIVSSIKFSYASTYNQFVETAFSPTNSIINMNGGMITPTGAAKYLIKVHYLGSSVTEPGGLYNQVNFGGLTVADTASSYDLISPTYYKSLMAVVTYQLTLGANVRLFDPLYETMQFGAKGSYMIGC